MPPDRRFGRGCQVCSIMDVVRYGNLSVNRKLSSYREAKGVIITPGTLNCLTRSHERENRSFLIIVRIDVHLQHKSSNHFYSHFIQEKSTPANIGNPNYICRTALPQSLGNPLPCRFFVRSPTWQLGDFDQ